MAKPYDKMTGEDFDRLLADVIDKDNDRASDLLSIPGVYEQLSEYYNNAVLDAWRTEQPDNEEQEGDDA